MSNKKSIQWLLGWLVVLVIASITVDGVAKAGSAFISANYIRAIYEDTYPWFQEGTLKEQLLVEAEHGNLKLYGFAPEALDELSPYDEVAFFLVSLEEGVNRIKDISSEISRTYTHYYIDNIQLPGYGNVLRLTGAYFTHHVLPTTYLISPEGVLLVVQGDSIVFETSDATCMGEEPSLRIITVSRTDSRNANDVLPWHVYDQVIHPEGGDFWSSVDVFQASPYERTVYGWCEAEMRFELAERTPVNHYAVAETLLRAIQNEDWAGAISLFSQDYFERYGIRSSDDLRNEVRHKISSCGAERLLGFPTPYTLRLEDKSGTVLDLCFDRDWCSAYRTSRRVFADGKETDVWVAPPLIDDIYVVQFLNAGQALDKLLATPSVKATFERFKGLSTPLGVLFENEDIEGFGEDDVTELAYYQARLYESHDTHIVTLGHYRVIKDTGEVYILDILTGEYILELEFGEPNSF